MENLADLINARLSDLGISRTELTQRLGFANQSKGLRRFDEFMDTGRRSSHLLKALPDALGLDTAQVETTAAPPISQMEPNSPNDSYTFRYHKNEKGFSGSRSSPPY